MVDDRVLGRIQRIPGKLVDDLLFPPNGASSVTDVVDLTGVTLSTLDFTLRIYNNWDEDVTVVVYDAATAIYKRNSFFVASKTSRTVLVEGWLSSGVGSITLIPVAAVSGPPDSASSEIEIRER